MSNRRPYQGWRSDLPGATWLLSAAQAINLTAAVIAVTISALVGVHLAPTLALGTVPYGAQFTAVMLCTYPASMLMHRYGRRAVFSAAAVLLITSGAVGMHAVESRSFIGLIVTHILLGSYIACANFYRFAAVDHVATEKRAKAISLVVAGGVAAGIVGPAIAAALQSVSGYAEFSLCYGFFIVLGILTLLLMTLWTPGKKISSAPPMSSTGATTWRGNKKIWAAMFCSAGGYLIMNLLMVQASLVMKDICSFPETSNAIRLHVLAMFVPSFFTGVLITKIGLRSTLLIGFVLLVGSSLCGMLAMEYGNILTTLVLLGLGWNFTYVGGGAMLAQSVDENMRHRWQGINDTAIAACATLGAFLPAPMLAGLGWGYTNMAMIPLCAIGMLLCWNVFSRKNVSPVCESSNT